MCDMFGSRCFEEIMSKDDHYKLEKCYENCKETQYNLMPSYVPLDIESICSESFMKSFVKKQMWRFEFFDKFDDLSKTCKDEEREEYLNKVCKDYVNRYVSYVSIDSPINGVTKSVREQRVNFSEKLAIFGGTLGLFSGMSLLSIMEIFCFITRFCKYGAKKLLYKQVKIV